MKISKAIIPLFQNFIKDSSSGKRLKINGERIKIQSIENYKYVLKNLISFSVDDNFELRICEAKRLSKKELISEKNYWKKFYLKFTNYLYKKGCHDNYVGANIKVIKTFLNYLKNDKYIDTGDFHRLFYVRKEEIQIFVLSPERLKFLIHDKDFEQVLTPAQKRVKDIFVFGCTTGLRYSDICLLTDKNFEFNDGDYYLKVKSKKNKTFSQVKLPSYAVQIYLSYKSKDAKSKLFAQVSLFNFNKTLKRVGELANFDDVVEISREKQGKAKDKLKKDKIIGNRFCDQMSSHMMRRTAITTLLILGMPEHLARKISGHSSSSSSFNRYIHYAQSYMDREIDKVHEKMEVY